MSAIRLFVPPCNETGRLNDDDALVYTVQDRLSCLASRNLLARSHASQTSLPPRFHCYGAVSGRRDHYQLIYSVSQEILSP